MNQSTDASVVTDAEILSEFAAMLEIGGPVVAVLSILSILVVAITIVKLLQFWSVRIGNRSVARRGLDMYIAGRSVEAQRLLEKSPNPTAQAVLRAIIGQRSRVDDAIVREEVTRYASTTINHLRSWLRPLEVIAALAPLLGLLGTVMGMIAAFQELEAAGNQVNPSILSGGIWEALLTTAVGLTVAIPTIVILNWLERKIERLSSEMEDLVTRVFTKDFIKADVSGQEYETGNLRADQALAN